MNEEQIAAVRRAQQAAAIQRALGAARPPAAMRNPDGQLSYMDLLRQADAQGQLGQPSAPMGTALQPIIGDPTGLSDVANRVQDNVVGIDNGRTSVGERVAALLNIGGESMTLGVVGDEAAGQFDAMIGRGPADQRTQFYRDQEARTRAETPGLALAADLAGGMVVPGSAGARFALGGANRAAQALRAGVVGAGMGAVQGFMEDEGSARERADGALSGAVVGGVFGAVAPSVIDGLSRIPRGVGNLFRRAATEPTVETLRALKNRAYQAVDEAGESFTPEQMRGLADRVRAEFTDSDYVDDVDGASRAVLRILENHQDSPTTLGQLDRIRQGFWARYAGARDQPRILDAIRAIDELIETTGDTSDLMRAARYANSVFAKTQLLTEAFERARDSAGATGSGGNVVNRYRQAVRSIIHSPKHSRFFSADEIDAMRAFVRGSTAENLQRLVGKLSPTGNGLIATLHALGGFATSGATLPLMAVGMGAKAAAENTAERGAERLVGMVAGQAVARPSISSGALTAGIGAVPAVESRLPVFRNTGPR